MDAQCRQKGYPCMGPISVVLILVAISTFVIFCVQIYVWCTFVYVW